MGPDYLVGLGLDTLSLDFHIVVSKRRPECADPADIYPGTGLILFVVGSVPNGESVISRQPSAPVVKAGSSRILEQDRVLDGFAVGLPRLKTRTVPDDKASSGGGRGEARRNGDISIDASSASFFIQVVSVPVFALFVLFVKRASRTPYA